MTNLLRAAAVAREFQIEGELVSAVAYGTGHINDTYRVEFSRSGIPSLFILQRVNTGIFHHPAMLMENILRVTEHVGKKLGAEPDSDRRVLRLIPVRHGAFWHQDPEGGFWRMFRFIDGAHTYDTVKSPEQAYQAARAFGKFQKMLVDLPSPRLHDTIPDFHNTAKRFKAFELALSADEVNRAVIAKEEVEFALCHGGIVHALLQAGLPERVTHNDTKFNNVLFDDTSGEGICVLDLDTVMPGLSLYDFGDMVRTATCLADEDEQDLSRIEMEFPLFEALARGYLESSAGFLTTDEKQFLAFAGKLITFEQGIRFLTDYLAGDTYYKVHRERQNLDRCRTQFKLIQSIEQQEERMNQTVAALVAGRTRSRV
jgi:hypothetical protein